MDIEFEIASTKRKKDGGCFIKPKQRRYSVTPILADLLKEPSGCFENFCRLSSHNFEYLLKNISPCSCSTYSPLGTVDIKKKFLHHVLGGMRKATCLPFYDYRTYEKIQL
ncbi:hypothetical protein Avbf_13659 [Armadillidium vulgare]|nr:hypothetical protein Avbf_13659 [Armadillidium vulgare]